MPHRPSLIHRIFAVAMIANLTSLIADEAERQVVHSVPLVRGIAPGLPARGTVHLGTLQPQEKVRFAFELLNHTGGPLHFDSVRGSCSCVDFTPQSGAIEDSSKLQLELTLNQNQRPHDTTMGGAFYLHRGQVPVAQIDFRYGIDSYAGFSSAVYTKTITPDGNDQFQLTIPFIATSDIDEEDIEISASGLGDTTSAKLNLPGRAITVQGISDDDRVGSLYGTVHIHDKVTDRSSDVTLILRKREPIKIFPNVLRFIRSEDGYLVRFVVRKESEAPTGKATIRVSDNLIECVTLRSSDTVTQFECELKFDQDEIPNTQSGVHHIEILICLGGQKLTVPVSATF